MKLLKITLLSLLVSASSQSFGQTFGTAIGGNVSSIHFSGVLTENSDFLDYYKSIFGFNAGGFYNLSFSDNMGMRFGLIYTGKGYRFEYQYSNTTVGGTDIYSESYSMTSAVRLNYVQINPMFRYQKPFKSNKSIYALVGPYVSIGIGGRQSGTSSFTYYNGTTTITDDSNSYDEKIKFGANGDGIDVLDFGFTPAIGMTFNKLFLEITYDLGLNNIDTSDDPDFKMSNRNLSFCLGYLFGK